MLRRTCKIIWLQSSAFPWSAGQSQPTQKAPIWPLFPRQRSKGTESESPPRWWFVTAFPWHKVLSYNDSALLIFYTLTDVKRILSQGRQVSDFQRGKGAVEVPKWACQMPRDVPTQNSATIAQECELWFLFFPHSVYTMWHALFTEADLSTLLYCWPAFISPLTLLTLASIWQLNTLHHSATFTPRTDVELIAAFFISNLWGYKQLP